MTSNRVMLACSDLNAITADVEFVELSTNHTIQRFTRSVPACEVCGWPLIMPWSDDTLYCSVNCKIADEVKL